MSGFGKLYRSCRNCSEQAARIATIENVTPSAQATSWPASTPTSATG